MILTGRIINEKGQPVPGAAVIAYDRYPEPYARVQADAGGVFMVSNVGKTESNSLTIVAEAPGYAPGMQKIEVNADLPPLPVEIRLKPGRSIACRVVDPNGRPVAGAWTSAHLLPEFEVYGRWQENSDAEGRFTIRDTPEGGVRLTVGRAGYFAVRDIPIHPTAGVQSVQIPPATRIRGAVSDAATGKPLEGFEVRVRKESGEGPWPPPPTRFFDGRYEVTIDEDPNQARILEVSAPGYRTTTTRPLRMDEANQVLDFKMKPTNAENATRAAAQPAVTQAEVYAMGEGVKRPGVYALASDRKITIKMLLASTGAIGEQKGRAVILVRRGSNAQDTRKVMLLENLFSGKATDIVLQHDDLLIVLPANDAMLPAAASRPASDSEVYMTGELGRPGVYSIRDESTLLRLLSACGYEPGDKGKEAIVLTHAPDGRELQTTVDLDDLVKGRCPDPLLRGGDVVAVRPRKAPAGENGPSTRPATQPASGPGL